MKSKKTRVKRTSRYQAGSARRRPRQKRGGVNETGSSFHSYSPGVGSFVNASSAASLASPLSSASTALAPFASASRALATAATATATAAAAAASSAAGPNPTVNSIIFDTFQKIYSSISSFCMEGYTMISTTLWVTFLSKLPDLARSSGDLVKDAGNAYYLYRYAMSIEIGDMKPAPSLELKQRFISARDALGKMLMTINNSGFTIRIFGIAYAKMNGRMADFRREVDALAEIYKYDENVPRLNWKTMDIANLTMFADWYRYEIVILVGNLNSILIELIGLTIPKIPTALPPFPDSTPVFLRPLPNKSSFASRLTPTFMGKIQTARKFFTPKLSKTERAKEKTE